jgi:transcriptional regulator with XRE-family HTH domain
MSGFQLSQRFGAVVRKRRIRGGISQEALAERAQLHPTYISMVERGVRNPTLDVADRIAAALKTTLPKLIEEAKRMETDKRE